MLGYVELSFDDPETFASRHDLIGCGKLTESGVLKGHSL